MDAGCMRNALRGDHTVEVCRGRLEQTCQGCWTCVGTFTESVRRGMVLCAVLGLSWLLDWCIFSGRGRQLVVADGVHATGLGQAPGVNRMQGSPNVSTGCGFTFMNTSVWRQVAGVNRMLVHPSDARAETDILSRRELTGIRGG